MFPGIFILVVPVVFSSQVTRAFAETNIDEVVNKCQNKVSRFAATEGKYAKAERKPAEPVLFGEVIEDIHKIVTVVDKNQRVFECIANVLNGSSDANLDDSQNYKNLVKKCELDRPKDPKCNVLYPYRTMNATCNNIDNPKWGSTLSCFRRLMPANYRGASGMRKAVSGKNLPLPRTVSLVIVIPGVNLPAKYNLLFIFFGQALAHDLGENIFTTINETAVLDCCKYARTRKQHPQCAPILLQTYDLFYSMKNISCLGVERMAPCHTCSLDKRVQMNQVTSYIDCSLTYGQYDERAMNLRRNDGSGKLLSQQTEAGELMPGLSFVEQTRCSRGPPEKKEYCFISGDTRTNQHSVLSMIQTLLLREHNRIADKLKNLNPHWDEEKLYQEARKILIAEFQVIVYKEFLPILLGKNLMKNYMLNIGSGGGYNSAVDPSISVEFNAAAFRLHTLIPGEVAYGEEYDSLTSLFVNVAPIYNDRTSSYLSKMAKSPSKEYNWFMPKDVTNYLYRENHGTYGYDLASLDIQRGRDVGLPSYSQAIEYFEKKPGTITKFEHVQKYLFPECKTLLETNYQDVRDVDLWVGLICEAVPRDMIISPTAAKFIAEQFKRLKFGDRFYFEYDETFNHEQRQTLKTASLAKLICDNTDILEIQPKAMLLPSHDNLPKLCSLIPGVDLEKWKKSEKRHEKI